MSQLDPTSRQSVKAPNFVIQVFTHRLFWPVVGLILLWVACGIALPGSDTAPGFWSITMMDGHLFGQIIDILRAAAPILLLALGMCLVIATGGIDLSVGAVMALSSSVSLSYLISSPTRETLPTVLIAIGLGLLTGLVVGLFNGTMVARLKIQPFIATLIIMVAGRGVAFAFTGGRIESVVSPPFKFLGSGFVLSLPTQVVIVTIVAAIVMISVRMSALGVLVESIGVNRQASFLAGVPASSILMLVYGLCGLLAGLAGMIYVAPTMATNANAIGLMLELDAILCVVLGGTALSGGKFYLSGTVVGALLVATLPKAVIYFGFPMQITPLFKGLVILIICIAQSQTLRDQFARRSLRRSVALAEGSPS
ncbi:MAG: ABC transporter permease [Propionibacteriaceae bacterium]|nr:ABC transporter permease [Propionibacteriaceae bacterium]